MSKQGLAWTLTLLGAIPFLVFSLGLLFDYYPVLSAYYYREFFFSYAAIILSFLAGIHWGIALNKPHTNFLLISSNIVALGGWFTLMLPSPVLVSILLFVGFSIQLIIDMCLYKAKMIEAWFIKLRSMISLMVLVTISFMFIKHL